jgi:hypothetical protein
MDEPALLSLKRAGPVEEGPPLNELSSEFIKAIASLTEVPEAALTIPPWPWLVSFSWKATPPLARAETLNSTAAGAPFVPGSSRWKALDGMVVLV